MQTTHILIHNHRHGTDIFPLACNHVPDLDQVIEILTKSGDLFYEPEREESLEIRDICGEVTVIP